MRVIILGHSEQKETILHLLVSEGFELQIEDLSEKDQLSQILKSSDCSGVIFFNPEYKNVNKFSEILRDKVTVAFYENWSHNIQYIMDENLIDFCVRGIPSGLKLKKILSSGDSLSLFKQHEYENTFRLSTGERTLFSRFIEKLPLGLLVFDGAGILQIYNRAADRIIGTGNVTLKTVNSYSDFEKTYPELFRIMKRYYSETRKEGHLSERFTLDDDSPVSEFNVFPFMNSNKLEGLFISLREDLDEYKVDVEVEKWSEIYENIFYRIMKTFDFKTIGDEIVDAVRRITGYSRIYITYGTEEEFERTVFRGFTQGEISKLKKIPYSLNLKSMLFTQKFEYDKDVYFISASEISQIGDLCFVSEKDSQVYDIILIPIKDKEDRIVGVIRMDCPENDIPSSVKVKVVKSIANNTAIALENARLHQNVLDREKFLSKIFDNSLENFIVLDNSYRILSFNKAGESITGYRREEVVGRKLTVIFDYDVLDEIRDILDKKTSFFVEKTLLRKDGSKVEVMMTVTSFVENNQNRVLLMLSDLSKLRNLQSQLIEMEKVSAISLAAVTANDKINTPLTIILAHLGILKYKGLDRITEKDFNDSVQIIEEQVDKIAKIVKKLRGVSTLKTRYYADRETLMLDIDSVDFEEDSHEF